MALSNAPPFNVAAKRSGEYWFDQADADAAVGFFPRYLRLTEGEWFNKPFVLAAYQQEIVRSAFGWKRKDGTRRYRRVYIWVPRKNGKTEFAAGLALLMLLGDAEPGGQVLSIATDKNQAALCFNKAAVMISLSDELQRHLTTFTTSVYCQELGAAFKPLAGIPKGKHGLSMSGMVGDEVHEWKNDRLYQFVHQSIGARRQPLEFMISTAGEMGGYGQEAFQMCEKILDGTIDDPETLVFIYGADAERDRNDPDYWKSDEALVLANPNYGVSPKAEYLQSERKKAAQLPRLENDFKRYHLNLWTEQATRWLPMDAWSDCGQEPRFRGELRAAGEGDRPVSPAIFSQLLKPADNQRWKHLAKTMEGRPCFGGVDLSSTTDLTCAALIFPPDGDDKLFTIVPRFFCPSVGIKRRSHTDKVPYEYWAKIGALTPTPGNAVDYDFIKAQLYRDAEDFDLKAVAFDRWSATQIAIQVEAEGINAATTGMGFQSMTGPSKELEKMLLSRSIDHGGHPVLSWCARNVAVSKDPAENIKPDKAKSTERIDGIVAVVIGIGVFMAAPSEPDIGDFLSNPVRA